MNESSKSTLRMLWELFDTRAKLKLVYLNVLMLTNSMFELLGLSAIPGIVLIIFSEDKIADIPWLGPVLLDLKASTGDSFMITIAVSVLVIFIVKNAFMLYLNYVKGSIIRNFQLGLSNRLFRRYLLVKYSFHLRSTTQQLFRNLNSEVGNVVNKVLLQLLNFFSQFLIGLGIIALLVATEPVVSLMIIVLFGIVSFGFLKVTRRRIKMFGEEMLRLRVTRNKLVFSAFDLVKEIKILNKSGFFIKKFNGVINRTAYINLHKIVIEKVPKALLEVLSITFMLSLIVVMMARQTPAGELIALLTLYAVAMARLMPIAGVLSTSATAIRYAMPSVRPIYEDIMYIQEEDLGEGVEFEDMREGEIVADSLQFKYEGTDLTVIDNLSLKIRLGTSVAFTGKSGAGKTTAVDLIMGLLTPESGAITCNGIDVSANKAAWRKNIAYIPQDIVLINDTLLANICLGFKDHKIDHDRVNYLLEITQLKEFVDSLPDGLDTQVGDRGMRLSGGQKQRVGIARALYDDPPILIMDEATSSLDNLTERFFVESLDQIKKNRTLIMIAHRMSTIEHCDTIFYLEKGRVKDQGTYEELISSSPGFRRLAHAQLEEEMHGSDA